MSQRNLHTPWVNQNGTAFFKGGWMKKHTAVEMSTGCKRAKVRFAKASPMISSSLALEGLHAPSNSGQCLAVLPRQSREISHSAGQGNPACIQHPFLRMLAAGTQASRGLTHSQAALATHGSQPAKERGHKAAARAEPWRAGRAGCSKVLQSPVLQSCPILCSGLQR